MKFIREFSYPDILQRRLVLYNALLTCMALSCLLFHTSFILKYRTLYEPVIQNLFLAGIAGFCTGNLVSNILFNRIQKSRPAYIIIEILFIIASLMFFFRNLLPSGGGDPAVRLYFAHSVIVFALMFGVHLLGGMKINYFIKISCGEFIDEQKGILTLLGSMIIAYLVGFFAAGALYCLPHLDFAGSIFIVLLVPLAFIIKLPYNPSPIYTQEMKEHREVAEHAAPDSARDDLFFNYLNFTYIIIYIFLGYQCVISHFGDRMQVGAVFFCVVLISLLAGYGLARCTGTAFWHIYTEMTYPVMFTLFLVLVYATRSLIQYYFGILFFIPVAMSLGFALYHSLKNITSNYDHAKRHSIIHFALFALPLPLVAALRFLEFTYLWYFVLLYTVSALNLIFPGMHLLQRKINDYKKAAFFVFTLFFIPLVIIVHAYFSIPFNNQRYVTRTTGFDTLLNTNYNAEFINSNSMVSYCGTPAFSSSDATIKNLQRCLVALTGFIREDTSRKGIVFIDGNTRFFRNPVITWLPGAQSLDYLNDRIVDYQRLPVNDSVFYFVDTDSIMSFLHRTRKGLGVIVSLPNIFDQHYNAYLFSSEFYGAAKTRLSQNGIFAQVINLTYCREEFVRTAAAGLKKAFARAAVFLFTDHVIIIASDSAESLMIDERSFGTYLNSFKGKQYPQTLFFNEFQYATHYLPGGVEFLMADHADGTMQCCYYLGRPRRALLDAKTVNTYLSTNAAIMELVDQSPMKYQFRAAIQTGLLRWNQQYTLLKMASLHENAREYEKESDSLMQLRKMSDYIPEIRNYIFRVIQYKEEYYTHEALNREKEKKWDDAALLYRSILKYNPDNFEANYRMGILSITLQNLDDAFEYLKKAMQLKKDDAKVLYQMGVLFFSSGRTEEALAQFTRAMELRDNSASINHYMGLCYEKMGRFTEARTYYEKALQIDPTDYTIQSSIQRINKVFEDEKNKWKAPDQKNEPEAELGESIPLPINKSARDIRLKDEE